MRAGPRNSGLPILRARPIPRARTAMNSGRNQVLCQPQGLARWLAFPPLTPPGAATLLPRLLTRLLEALDATPSPLAQCACPRPVNLSRSRRTRSLVARRSENCAIDGRLCRTRRSRSVLPACTGELRGSRPSSRKSLARDSGAKECAWAFIGSAAEETGAVSQALV